MPQLGCIVMNNDDIFERCMCGDAEFRKRSAQTSDFDCENREFAFMHTSAMCGHNNKFD